MKTIYFLTLPKVALTNKMVRKTILMDVLHALDRLIIVIEIVYALNHNYKTNLHLLVLAHLQHTS